MAVPQLVTGSLYHIFSRSIAEFRIFNNDNDFQRMKGIFKYYQVAKRRVCFSHYNNAAVDGPNNICGEKLVNIIAYCIMPTHFHLILKQRRENGISIYMNKLLNSYTRYFNIKYDRKGPLWEARFQRVFVETDEQLLHLTRYIHLNPVTAYIVDSPDEWRFSSYHEYQLLDNSEENICSYQDVLKIKPDLYKKFVEENIANQRKLAAAKPSSTA